MSVRAESLLHCSFCDKSQELVRKLIAGPGVYVCDECVGLCNQILDDDGLLVAEGSAMSTVSVEMLLAHLASVTAESDRLVAHLRDRGVEWDLIASVLRKDDST